MNPILEKGRRFDVHPCKRGEFNGVYQLNRPGEARCIFVIATDGFGWEHVSVSFGSDSKKTPSWELMSWVKDLFWNPECTVMQLHPPKSVHINFHPGCLHLWRPLNPATPIPVPPWVLIGPKERGGAQSQDEYLQLMSEVIR